MCVHIYFMYNNVSVHERTKPMMAYKPTSSYGILASRIDDYRCVCVFLLLNNFSTANFNTLLNNYLISFSSKKKKIVFLK